MKVNKSNRDIVLITRIITESVRVFAEQKGIKIHFSSTVSELKVGIDEEKYERIMLNLLSNSIKFTSEGKNINVNFSMEKLAEIEIEERHSNLIDERLIGAVATEFSDIYF
jgi:signal transduction histidine kinase